MRLITKAPKGITILALLSDWVKLLKRKKSVAIVKRHVVMTKPVRLKSSVKLTGNAAILEEIKIKLTIKVTIKKK